MGKREKHKKQNKKITKIIFGFLIIIFICGIGYLTYYLFDINKNKENNEDILKYIIINKDKITDDKTERMLQLEELQKENDEIVAWLQIDDTHINYPIVQAKDNDFYLTHNYKKEYSSCGSLFLDKDFDLLNGSSNYLIYGHRNKQGLMFEDLLKYANDDFYKEHTKIKFTTNQEDCLYEVLAVFYSKVYYKSDKNVFRYYYFVNAKDEKEYNEFVQNSKKISIYDTGVTAEYGEQLITLSTCEYSQEDGRFVVVCKKIK